MISHDAQADTPYRPENLPHERSFDRTGVGKVEAEVGTGRLLRVNAAFCEMLGYTAEDLLSLCFHDITHPDDLAECERAREQMLSGQTDSFTTEKRYLRKDGQPVWVSVYAEAIRDSGAGPLRAIAIVQNITSRKRAEWLQHDRGQILEMVIKDCPLDEALAKVAQAVDKQIGDARAAVLLPEEGHVRVISPGLPPEWRRLLRLHGMTLAVTLSSGAWDSEGNCGVTYPENDGVWQILRPAALVHSVLACWTVPITGNDGGSLGLISVFGREARRPTAEEIEILDAAARLAGLCIEHHTINRQLAHRVRHDPLTNLPNRIMLEDAVHNALALAERSGRRVAFLALDIDHFKLINDMFGHDAGDHLLQLFAYRLGTRLRKSDTLARIGGDEFVIVLPELANRDQAAAVARKLVDALAQPFEVDTRQLQATASIGIAITPDHGADHDSLQKKADAALYQVKSHSRNGFAFSQ